MLIDWFTVIAQIVNFLILIILLKYLLYNRIVKAMDEREKKIHVRLKEAEEKEREAEREAESFRTKNRDFDEKREAMLAEVKKEAETRRKELTREARQSVTNLRSLWEEAIQREKKSFVRDLRKMTGVQVYAITRKALRDLADAELEERTIDVFLAQIQGMDKKQREVLTTAIKEEGNELSIRSAFEISAQMREKMTRALRRQIDKAVEIHYETASDLIMGIELKTKGRKIAWNLQHYLDTLEENALQALEKEARRKTEQDQGALAEQKKQQKEKQPRPVKKGMSKRGSRKPPKETDESTAP